MEEKIQYYILFETYTQGMQLYEQLRGAGITSRIAPAPRQIQGKLGCGMSLLVQPEEIDAVREFVKENQSEYYDIVPLACQINPRRNKFC